MFLSTFEDAHPIPKMLLYLSKMLKKMYMSILSTFGTPERRGRLSAGWRGSRPEADGRSSYETRGDQTAAIQIGQESEGPSRPPTMPRLQAFYHASLSGADMPNVSGRR